MNQVNSTLPEDMKFLKSKINQLCDHTGLPSEYDNGEEAASGANQTTKDAAVSYHTTEVDDENDEEA